MPARNLYSDVEHQVLRLRTSGAILLFPLYALMAWTRTNLPFIKHKTMASWSTYWLGMKGGSTTFCLKWRGKAKNGAHCSSSKFSKKFHMQASATVWNSTTLILWPPRYHHKPSDPKIMDCSVSISFCSMTMLSACVTAELIKDIHFEHLPQTPHWPEHLTLPLVTTRSLGKLRWLLVKRLFNPMRKCKSWCTSVYVSSQKNCIHKEFRL